MINLKGAAKFLLVFLAAYLFMLWPITGIQKKYADFFCKIGNESFHEFGDNGIAMLKTQKGKDNILLLVSNTSYIKQGQVIWQDYHKSSNLIGFFHTAFLLSLIIATPVSLRRKTFAMIVGFLLITGFVMLKLYSIILYCYSISTTLGLSNDIAAHESIAFWYNNFSMPFARGYTIVVILWVLLCIGKKEWQMLNGILAEKVLIKNSTRKKSSSKKVKKRN